MTARGFPGRARGDPLLAFALTLLIGAVPATTFAQTPATPDPQNPAQADRPAPPEGFFHEPHFLAKAIDFGARTGGDGTRVKNGFYPEVSNMITGAGWISVGPGYRHWFYGDSAIVEASAAYSWRGYKMGQARFDLPKLAHSRVAAGSQVRWQDFTQISYFGEGPDAPDSDRSEYRLKSTDVVGYMTVRPIQWLAVNGSLGWLQSPALLSPAGSFKRGNPDTREIFADDVVFTFADQPSYLHNDVTITADTRDYRSHPTSGGMYRAGMASYIDRGAGAFSFTRFEAEGAHFVPIVSDRIVFALHGWMVGSMTGTDQSVPFYLEPSLGGHNTVRAYTDYRFHDRNMVVVNVESRLALFTHVDLAGFVDAGNVAPRVADLNLDKRAYGVGLRLHSERATFARLDVAHGTEGWRFLFRMSDPLHLSRLSRRTATDPFAP